MCDYQKCFSSFFLTGDHWLDGFRTGYAIAIGVIFVFTIIALIVLAVLRSRTAKGVATSTAAGEIFISAKAIADLIFSIAKTMPEIEVSKVTLTGKKGKFTAHVTLDYFAGDGAKVLPDAVQSLQCRAMASLSETFGVKSVTSVAVTVARSKSAPSKF